MKRMIGEGKIENEKGTNVDDELTMIKLGMVLEITGKKIVINS